MDRFAHLGETEMLWKGTREFALQTRWDRIVKLGQIDLVQNVNVRIFGGTDMSTRWDRFH